MRGITFKCADSFFFQEFDGEWKVTETIDPNTRRPECLLSYVVDVRPKGPVPVAALEWRIREDVPTNLRAVKRAAMTVGARGVSAQRHRKLPSMDYVGQLRASVVWDKSETMAAYLGDVQQQ